MHCGLSNGFGRRSACHGVGGCCRGRTNLTPGGRRVSGVNYTRSKSVQEEEPTRISQMKDKIALAGLSTARFVHLGEGRPRSNTLYNYIGASLSLIDRRFANSTYIYMTASNRLFEPLASLIVAAVQSRNTSV